MAQRTWERVKSMRKIQVQFVRLFLSINIRYNAINIYNKSTLI